MVQFQKPTSDSMSDLPIKTYDLIGCGFGPASLAIAAALVDKWSDYKVTEQRGVRNVLFVERQPRFLWHPGMLLPGSRMQIRNVFLRQYTSPKSSHIIGLPSSSCLKDLVTLRRPTSSLTFLSYLHSQNRLITFINRGSTIPTRREFADYLAWAAAEVEKRGILVAYAEEVIGISEVDPGLVEVVSRRVEDQFLVKRRTKHVILSSGGIPHIPHALSSLCPLPSTIIHTSTYTSSIGHLLQSLSSSRTPLSIGVIGSGQSATEVLLDLHNRLASVPVADGQERHKLDMIIRKGCLKPSDDSPFVNEIFDPESTDSMYSLPTRRARNTIQAEYRNTNYGVVNSKTLENLYEVMYEQKLDEGITKRSTDNTIPPHPQITIRAYQSIISATNTQISDTQNAPITLTLQHTLTRGLSSVTYDALICGTGYDRHVWLHMLRASNLAKRFGIDRAVFHDPDTPFALIPEHEEHKPDHIKLEFVCDDVEAGDCLHSSASSAVLSQSDSLPSTPPTTPSISESSTQHTTLRISRNYRLIPSDFGDAPDPFKSRIYLQGYAESTHGLSDTLLSVLGVRAGEVIDDIWEAEERNTD